MNHTLFELPFFTNLLILIVSAKLLGEIFERFKQPSMIGEILAGIILGPSIINLIHRTEEIKVVSEIGIFLLVIKVGLEINIASIIRSLKGRSLIISILAFFIPIISGISVGFFFQQGIMPSLFIGLCVAITALPVSIRILMDLGKLQSDIGQKIISVAIFDDVLALTFLGLLININSSDFSVISIIKSSSISLLKLVVFIVTLSSVYLLVKRILRRGDYLENSINKLISLLKGNEPLFALFFAFILLFSTFTEMLGLHFIVGAFFGSMLISEELIGKENLKTIEKSTSNIAMGFLAPVFFAGIGLEFNFYSIQNIGLLLAVIVVSYLSKIAGGYFGGLIAGYKSKTSFILGIGLNARGIMELLVANIAYNAKLINTEVFSILVIMGIVTTLTTPFVLKKSFQDE
ncbi:MAG: cation:proton antiporter [Bacteroidales bacterium]|nr:cation:proton antiporter [Bacteroidales bacterium]